MVTALYFLELGFTKKRTQYIAIFAIFLYAAILTHYCSAGFTVALGIYSLARLIAEKTPLKSRFVVAWLIAQAGALAIYSYLYFSHIHQLQKSDLAYDAYGGWLHKQYFHPDVDSLLAFPLNATAEAFEFFFSSTILGMIFLILFLAGLVLIILASSTPQYCQRSSQSEPRRNLALLLILPFVISCMGAMAGYFPYGGTRHSIFLIIFAITGLSIALAKVSLRNFWTSIILATALTGIINIEPRLGGHFMNASDQSKINMKNLMSFVATKVPPNATIFVDNQTSVLLGYYLSKYTGYDKPTLFNQHPT